MTAIFALKVKVYIYLFVFDYISDQNEVQTESE